MPRIVTLGAAQLGPIALAESRAQVVERLIAHLREAAARGCDLVVFPELALTTFFPRWFMEEQSKVDAFFEREMPGPETQPLFDEAKRLGLAFSLGYAELAEDAGRTRRFNSSILVDKQGHIVGKYRKIHLPGHAENEPWRAFQHLEKRYFETGNLGFPVFDALGGRIGLCICNDRRWPETYRVMGLQGVEMVLLGYNTPVHHPPAPEHDRLGWFHNQLVMQSGAYQNATWVVGVAKAGNEEGVPMIGGTQIIAPTGETVAVAVTEEDELITAACDLDLGLSYKQSVFDFARHREPEQYRLIVETKGPLKDSSDAAE
ncbi:N-carbamoyl-D-amino-acid hydrolase [Algihabitans albus]|uniref:N-carbamoyl-D-amino-acid hydrolase n=1 Tax=Algihabitans albus TaxID=2164067 RepID=UPI000E5CA53B|nr:N-carbamoyl-D-amino-acid hydrolase [Algihabitans albus]